MALERKNIFQNQDIDKMTSKISEALYDGIEKYWEQDIKLYLSSVNDFKSIREEYFTQDIDFFTSQVKVETHKPIVIRLSKEFIDSFLSATLGEIDTEFNLIKLSKLETKILNSFCEFLFKKINSALIPVEKVKISEKSTQNVNLLYSIKNKSHPTGILALSVPLDRIEFIPLVKKVNFSDSDFMELKTPVRVRAGSTKISYDDLKNLSSDDIVLLEDSNTSKLTLISGDLEQKFNIRADSSLIFNMNNKSDKSSFQEIQNNNEVTMEKSLWDDIQIELSAEFEKVKMTISELKQITQGQIVDLGSVFDNEIALYVENKKIASGELIIINDRYAVKLNKVINANPPKVQSQQAPTQAQSRVNTAQTSANPQAPARPAAPARPQAPARPAPAPRPQAPKQENEEFDYSDFEK